MSVPKSNTDREQLLAIGKRAAYKNQCKSVLVAPDHTGQDNYHNCDGAPDHEGAHRSNSYVWNDGGEILGSWPRKDSR